MKIIVVGKKLEDSLFEIVRISKALNSNTVFFKKEIKTEISLDDVFVIDSDLIDLLPKELNNIVISVVSTTNYSAILKNETCINLQSIHSIEKIIRKTKDTFTPIVMDPSTKKVFAIADKIACTDATVLIVGETGTGKEVLAKYIHQTSDRCNGRYVSVNCAAIPDTLLESELFGHERGAFTNAIQKRIGKFEEANNGTILLDEISEMSLSLQAKLLRIIQEKEVSRLGGNENIKLNVRIVATSNKNLREAVSNGTFREDLFYRLNVIPIEMPRLNCRPLDIEPLAKFFCRKYSNDKKMLSSNFLMSIKNHEWNGNIRELENVVHRSVLLSSDKVVNDTFLDAMPSIKTLKDMERETILETIEQVNGNKKLASEKLGIPVRTLRYKLNLYNAS